MKTFKHFYFEAINGPKIIMIGGPGSGKSTYSDIIKKELNIPHIYTGEMLRAISKTNTPDGKEVKRFEAGLSFNLDKDKIIKEIKDEIDEIQLRKFQ